MGEDKRPLYALVHSVLKILANPSAEYHIMFLMVMFVGLWVLCQEALEMCGSSQGFQFVDLPTDP